MSSVVLTFECPNLRETMMLGTPWFSIRDAAVWRRSWKRISGNPDKRKSFLKLLYRLLWLIGVPIVDGKTRSLSVHR